MVNISSHHSDAIILYEDHPVTIVPLPFATPDAVTALADRSSEPVEMTDTDTMGALRGVWTSIVKPISDKLTELGVPRNSRIWWSPTGPANRIPLHAAGPYRKGEKDMLHMYASSYTPTLTSLLRARKAQSSEAATKDVQTVPDVLLVSQPLVPGESPLPHVAEEVDRVKGHATRYTILDGEQGTHEKVLKAILVHPWVHIASHGHHDDIEPFHSSIKLYDRPLSLLDLVKEDLGHAELAVLSACHSAKVNPHLPDESLHIATGFMFCGFRSVVGTMWAMADEIGPVFADKFYERMLPKGERPKRGTFAAKAVKHAVASLTKEERPLIQRINFIHVGI